jgi:hypothetical protein
VDYRIVYDLASEGYQQWWIPTVGVVIAFAFVLGIVFREFFKPVTVRPAIFWVAAGFARLVSGNAFIQTYGAYRTLLNDVRAGRAEIVEGSVTQFQPARPGKGKATEESFVVADKTFVYSDQDLGFHQTHPYDGPIQDGLNVRISYVPVRGYNIITRLEIRR